MLSEFNLLLFKTRRLRKHSVGMHKKDRRRHNSGRHYTAARAAVSAKAAEMRKKKQNFLLSLNKNKTALQILLRKNSKAVIILFKNA